MLDSTPWQEVIETPHDFVGTKLALVSGDHILVYRRDDKPTIPYPNQWDLPGGGREGAETPFECGARELREEFALPLRRDSLRWARAYSSLSRPNAVSWFIAADIGRGDVAAIRFGDEGQEWRMVPCAEFMRKADAVPYLRDRLADYIASAHQRPVV